VNSGPAGPGRNIRVIPADGEALLKAVYELRALDGKRICSIGREAAERGLADGRLELWAGRHGVYLRYKGLPYPDQPRDPNRLSTDSHPQAPKGAIRPVVLNRRHPATGQVGSFRTRRVGPA